MACPPAQALTIPEDTEVGGNGGTLLAARAGGSEGPGHGSVDYAVQSAPERPQQVPPALLSAWPPVTGSEKLPAYPRSHSKGSVPHAGGVPSLPGSFGHTPGPTSPRLARQDPGDPQKALPQSKEKAPGLPTWTACPSFFP